MKATAGLDYTTFNIVPVQPTCIMMLVKVLFVNYIETYELKKLLISKHDFANGEPSFHYDRLASSDGVQKTYLEQIFIEENTFRVF